jgi:DNA (cytosine-5)-methyltransferase 1
MPNMNVLSLFAGIGGLDLGLERAGMTVVGQVEIDPFCQAVLARHWPKVPRHDDVHTTPDWWKSQPRPAVHVIAGGFPCQPVSQAGLRLANQDARWLWPAMADTIAEIRPDWVIGENVPGLLYRGIADVLGDLARIGYRARAGVVSACAMGAPHTRERLFILAHPDGQEWRPGRMLGTGSGEEDRKLLRDGSRHQRRPWWASEPNVDRVAYGVPRGMDRRRALGNAVVPQVAEYIGRMITASQHEPEGTADA